MAEALVEFRNLRVSYGPVQALAGVSGAFPPGPTGLLGPNGAGKSTFLKLAAGLLEFSQGEVKVLGEPTSYTEGPNLGLTWCYFMAPWGAQLEIVSAPKGTVFDNEAKKNGTDRLFHPKYVAETAI